jgi:Reverse transcriptase (RNA-dependent DNA polymerase)
VGGAADHVAAVVRAGVDGQRVVEQHVREPVCAAALRQAARDAAGAVPHLVPARAPVVVADVIRAGDVRHFGSQGRDLVAEGRLASAADKGARNVARVCVCDLVVRSRLPGSDVAGLLLQVDFRKAYDSVSFEAMSVTLRGMGFSLAFVQMVDGLLKGYRVRFTVRGVLSSPLSVMAGIAQGGPFMVLLFLLYCDPFLRVFSAKVGGLRLTDELRVPAFQYADDFTALLCDEFELMVATTLLSQWGNASNLVASPPKSSVYPLDLVTEQLLLRDGSHFCFCDDAGRNWELQVVSKKSGKTSVRILGLFFSAIGKPLDLAVHVDAKVRAVERAARMWRSQRLDFSPSCIVASACLSSRLEFLAIFTEFQQSAVIDRVNRASRFAIFGGRSGKSAHVRPRWDWLRLPRVFGGMGVQDLGLKILALRAGLVFRWLYLSRGGVEMAESRFWDDHPITPGPWVEVFSAYVRSVAVLLSCSVDVALLRDQRRAIEQRLRVNPFFRTWPPTVQAADRTSPPALAFAAWWELGGGFSLEASGNIFPGYLPDRRGHIMSVDLPVSGNRDISDPAHPDRPFVDWRFQDRLMVTCADANIGAVMHINGYEINSGRFPGARTDEHGIMEFAERVALASDGEGHLRSYVDSLHRIAPESDEARALSERYVGTAPEHLHVLGKGEYFVVDEVGWRTCLNGDVGADLYLFRVDDSQRTPVLQWHLMGRDMTRTQSSSLQVEWREGDGRSPLWRSISLSSIPGLPDTTGRFGFALEEKRRIYRRVLIREFETDSRNCIEIFPITAADALSLLKVSCGNRRDDGTPLCVPDDPIFPRSNWSGVVRDVYATVAKERVVPKFHHGLFGGQPLTELRGLFKRLNWLRLPGNVFTIAYGFITDSVYLWERWHRAGVARSGSCRRCHGAPETVAHVVACPDFANFRQFVRQSVRLLHQPEFLTKSDHALFSLSFLPQGNAVDAWVAGCACAYEVMDWALRNRETPDDRALQARWRENAKVCIQAARAWYGTLARQMVIRGMPGDRVATHLEKVRERVGWYEECLGGRNARQAERDGSVSFFGGESLPDVGDTDYWFTFGR